MIPKETLLIRLLKLSDKVPPPPSAPHKRGKGRPILYSETLFLKALVLMIVRRLHSVGELYSVLLQPTDEMKQLRELLSFEGQFPSRRTFERRLKALPETLPAQIGALGRHLVTLLEPWQQSGRAVAVDSTVLRALGGVWHRKDREAGVVPHKGIDTQAHWTKSGWHGWVYGWKLHLICTAGAMWIPLAADLTPANCSDGEKAPDLLLELPAERLYVLGDHAYLAEKAQEFCRCHGYTMIASRRGSSSHGGSGLEVRRVFYKIRTATIENFNEQYKSIFAVHQNVPCRGLVATKRFALGAVFVYQLALLYGYENALDLRKGLKSLLRAA
jgi:hypothetical protein